MDEHHNHLNNNHVLQIGLDYNLDEDEESDDEEDDFLIGEKIDFNSYLQAKLKRRPQLLQASRNSQMARNREWQQSRGSAFSSTVDNEFRSPAPPHGSKMLSELNPYSTMPRRKSRPISMQDNATTTTTNATKAPLSSYPLSNYQFPSDRMFQSGGLWLKMFR